MADEQQTQETEQTTETTAQQTHQAAQVPETQQPQEPPHPLEPGGTRFNEVYARMKQAEDRAARFEGMLQAQQQPRPQPQGPTYVAPAQLQVLVDRGQLTPADMANIISQQNAQVIAAQTVTQAVQVQQLHQKLQSAGEEVNQYLAKLPTLRDSTSPEFGRVRDEAYRLAEDMNLPVQDLRVQRAACRAAFGTLDRITSAQQTRQVSRDASLPHTETSGGGAPRTAGTQPGGADPLKDVDPLYLRHWEKRGYTREQMIEESKYIPQGRKVRSGTPR